MTRRSAAIILVGWCVIAPAAEQQKQDVDALKLGGLHSLGFILLGFCLLIRNDVHRWLMRILIGALLLLIACCIGCDEPNERP